MASDIKLPELPSGKRVVLPKELFEFGDEIFLEAGEHNFVTDLVLADDSRIGQPIPKNLIVWRDG